MTEAVRMEGITKTFGGVKANDRVDFAVRKGEIHALLGENGAGKSTLMNMLSGIYRPDSGFIYVDGVRVALTAPSVAIALGIGMIHQHFKLVEVMNARDNITLGLGGLLSGRAEVDKKLSELAERYGISIDPDKKVYDMSVSEKQTLEIIKVLYRGASTLIMDEPTAVLTPQEIEGLFRVIRNMRDQGCAVIIITHKLNEVMEVSDRITVLRAGMSVGTVVTADTAVEDLIELMVGKKIDLSIKREDCEGKQVCLEIKDLRVKGSEGVDALSGVSFTLYTHEILGIAGIAGSGQKELCETIAGLMKAESGSIYFEGKDILGKSAGEIIRLGIRLGFIPEDRLGMGLVASMDITDNVILKDYSFQKGIGLSRKPGKEKARRIVDSLGVLTPGISTPVGRLSGGNIQKILLGREIDSAPKALVTAYPVRGLDIGATYKIYDLLSEQKKAGVAVLFIGEDLDVLLELCDRIMVLSSGKVAGIVDAEHTSKMELGLMMTGAKAEAGAA